MNKKKIVYRRDYDEEGNWMHTLSKYELNEDGSLTLILNLALSTNKNNINNSIGAGFIYKAIIDLLKKGDRNG